MAALDEGATVGSGRPNSTRAAKRERQALIQHFVASRSVGSQHELVGLLAGEGVEVTQATVSRDISELGLVKVVHDGRHVYASPDELTFPLPPTSDDRLKRVLADYAITVGRSGLTLLIVSEAGTAGAIGQAIDESTLDEQEGTLAGDNTVLVLFADEARLSTWLERFDALRPTITTSSYLEA